MVKIRTLNGVKTKVRSWTLEIPESTLQRVKKLAFKLDMKIVQVIRVAIVEYLDRKEGES